MAQPLQVLHEPGAARACRVPVVLPGRLVVVVPGRTRERLVKRHHQPLEAKNRPNPNLARKVAPLLKSTEQHYHHCLFIP